MPRSCETGRNKIRKINGWIAESKSKNVYSDFTLEKC
jgi:hypothetical protein